MAQISKGEREQDEGSSFMPCHALLFTETTCCLQVKELLSPKLSLSAVA